MTHKKRLCRFAFLSLLLAVFAVAGLAIVHSVPKNITPEDTLYIEKIFEEAGYDINALRSSGAYDDEIRIIRAVQDAVLKSTPVQQNIPKGQSREPKDLYLSQQAECFDRSRTIDKALRMLGFETRYASIYSLHESGSVWRTFLTKGGEGVRSHALVEVKTERGWLFVDSNSRWISLTPDWQPVSLAEWQAVDNKNGREWDPANTGNIYPLMLGRFVYVYGLYSRNGQLYPPYNPVPDINWGEFLDNLRS